MKQLIAQKANFGDDGFIPATGAYSTGSDVDAGAVTNLELFISNVIGFLTILGALFFIFYFVMGGLSWITAAGDSGKIQKARDQMLNGVIGLIVIVASYSLIGIIGSVFGVEILNPRAMLQSIIPATQ
jgi:hypothetical protein